METKKHLFIGFGQLASSCAQKLVEQGHNVVGIARSMRTPPDGIEYWQGDVKSDAMLQNIAKQRWDSASITLTPSQYDEVGYKEAYFDVVDKLVELWQREVPPKRILFISSSSVYGQCRGEIVDEDSETAPSSATARVLKETEILLLNSGLNSVIVRFSGIYGSGRDFLLRQVCKRNGGNAQFTNRIHVDDCVGVMLHLLSLPPDNLRSVYLASDSLPIKSCDIRRWLAPRLGINENELLLQESSGRAGNKQCKNTRLIESGYIFRYPSFEEGYPEVINEFLAKTPSTKKGG